MVEGARAANFSRNAFVAAGTSLHEAGEVLRLRADATARATARRMVAQRQALWNWKTTVMLMYYTVSVRT